MLTKKQSIENFKSSVCNLAESKYILADRKVGEILKSIASSKLLYELFEHVTQDFDYATFKGVCFTISSEGNGFFTLPMRDDDVLAFVFLLLIDIDSGREDILSICEKYFASEEGKQASFDLFISNVIVPFCNITEKVAYELINYVISPEEPTTNNNENQVNDSEKMDDNSNENATCERQGFVVKGLREAIGEELEKVKNSRLSVDVKMEIGEVLGLLESAVYSNDTQTISMCLIAYKYIAQTIKKPRLSFDAINDLISKSNANR